ncbi:hypothetical protein GGQ97_002047 [Sphingomonas kaistensis]|uniref:Uncharacterized protein n=1 Tax=Sphingomonas kaistensis TaxID=298708 RepID=A0A7X5Y6S6_9SPHN|nr:hypothetical protein [Sphingomonas kaistensis]NJC06254.1 hypothetical protein [Sphingomonas kaistensis]
MLVLTILAFTAILALGLFTIGETLAGNRGKIAAALGGHSLLAEPTMTTRPVTVRVVSRRVSQPVTARPQLRAAA